MNFDEETKGKIIGSGDEFLEKICWKVKTEKSPLWNNQGNMNVRKDNIRIIEEKELGWFGHVMQKRHERIPGLIFKREPAGM